MTLVRGTLVVWTVLAVLAAVPVQAQPATGPTGQMDVTVSTQGGAVALPGVVVTVTAGSGAQLAQAVSDTDGHVIVRGLPPGSHHVRASLDGFDPAERVVTVGSDVVMVALDLAIAALAERVDVTASPAVSESGSLAAADTVAQAESEQVTPGGGVPAALRLLPTVIATQAGESINGGRPGQAGYQIGAASLTDPATNVGHIWLPADGVDSVAVLPDPDETEFGRLAAGLVVVQTRSAGEHWKFGVNNTVPAFRTRRFTVANIQGLGDVRPSVELGGPLVERRLFIEQTAQYHWDSTDVPSRPENELKTSQWYGGLTRVDAVLPRGHAVSVTGGFDRMDAGRSNLGTFTPPEATVHLSDGARFVMGTDRQVWHGSTLVESTVQVHEYDVEARGHGTLAMTLRPDTTLGTFFNRQHRDSSAVQWVETVSTSHKGRGGVHLVKVGGDVMTNRYDGTSASMPVLVERADGTLARRLDFSGPTGQRVRSVDAAVFAQDRLQPAKRWYVEGGGRIDRDGIAQRVDFSPRVGAAVVLDAAARAVLRGGYGVFYERTPSVAGAFTSFEIAVDSRFAADGTTLTASPTPLRHVVGDLHSARSTAWDVAFTEQLSARWAVHASLLDRHGSQQLVLNPVDTGAGTILLLTSDGRSRYVREEAGIHFADGARLDLNASYVHASARENLNAFGAFYGSVPTPVVGQDAYAPSSSDTPQRLLLRGHLMPTQKWMLTGSFDWRAGLPYSVVNEALEFVGARNAQRFPAFARTELGMDRRVTVGHAHPWVGIRAANAFGAFLPTDVQSNLGAPDFGTFYNSEYRQIRIHLRFQG
jgi:hypothetical protein